MKILSAMVLALVGGCSSEAPESGAGNRSGQIAPDVISNGADAVAVEDNAAAEAPPVIAAPPGSVVAASETLRRYFWLVGHGDYDAAYALWQGGAAGMSRTAFAQSFAKYGQYEAVIGQPGRPDSGAGNVYIEIPVRVSGMLRSGGPFVMEGPVRLHRVNDVPGSTEADRAWHIVASGLRPRPIQQGQE